MVMSGTRIIVMEPVPSTNSMGFQDFASSTWRQEVIEQQHRQRFSETGRQSTEDVVWIILIQGISHSLIICREVLILTLSILPAL